MTEIYTTGTWTPYPGKEEAFVEAWAEFASWASGAPGAGVLSLTRDLGEAERFVSFGGWTTIEAAHEWKRSPEFRERMARVQQHVAEFHPSELRLVAIADAGTVQTHDIAVSVPAN